MASQNEDDEISRLLHEKAEEFDLPPELVTDIYEAEQRVVNMERRSRIYKRVHELLEDCLD
jgi:hypothetical protein